MNSARLHQVLLAALALGLAVDSAMAQEDVVRIEVDTARSSVMPELMRAGVFLVKSDLPDYALRQWLSESRPGVVEIDIGGPVFQQAEDAEDVVRRARRLVPLLKRIRAAGGDPVLAITRIPIWLSSRPRSTEAVEGDVMPKASVVAPRDGNEWAALVARVVGEFKQGLGKTPDIKIGWEPDQSAWQGSEADFFGFYRDTVRGVKRGDANARVGGPGVSALYNGKGGEGAPPMIPRFLRFCADTPLAELNLQRLPVDFLIWHQFGSEAVLSWELVARQARAWLKQAGYPEATELFIGEWSSWYSWPRPESPEQDRPALAAYIVASLAAMQRAGIARAAFTSLLEQREVEAQPFVGSFGLFTNQYIKKAGYWAFSAIARLGSTQLVATSSDPLVSVIAGKPSAREVALVVAVSTPNQRSLQRVLAAKAMAAGASFEQLRRDLDGRQLDALTLGELKPESLRISDTVRQALVLAQTDVAPLASRSAAQRGHARSISVDLVGFDAAAANVEIWRIDSQHANAHALQERIAGFLQQRLNDEKHGLAQGLTRRFQERGYPVETVEVFKQVMNARNREEAFASRPPPQRKVLRELADEFQAYVHERLSLVGEEVNAWPELAFKADERPPNRHGNRIEFEMEDDSLALLRIIRR